MLPIVAAVLLATSCSKDNDGDNSVAPVIDTPDPIVNNEVDNQPKTVPFSIDVVSGGALSKIAYADDGTVVTMKFDADEVKKLKMTVSYKKDESTTVSTDLTLESVNDEGNGTFKGEWQEGDEPSEGTSLTATVVYNDESSVVSSTESVKELMEECKHTYRGEFKYINDKSVTLGDDRAYIEFDLEKTQYKVYVNGSWYDLNDGKGWVAVEGGTDVATRIKGTKNLQAGKIYKIEYKGYVDLGQTINGKKILWKTTNETGVKDEKGTQYSGVNEAYTDEWYYDWATACKFGTSTEVATDRLPTKAELEALANIKSKPQDGESYSFANGGATFTTAYGSVFFPAAGRNGGEVAGSYGDYWSPAPYDSGRAWYLYFYVDDAGVDWNYSAAGGFSVRLVRGL